MTRFFGTGKTFLAELDCFAYSASSKLTASMGSPVSSKPWVFFLLVKLCWPERGLSCRPFNPPDLINGTSGLHSVLFFLLLFFFSGGVPFSIHAAGKKNGFLCFLLMPLVLQAACALFLHVRGWRNVLASPLPSCHELPGRMGPIVGRAHRHSPLLQCQACCGLSVWSAVVTGCRGARSASSHFFACCPLFRSVLGDGSGFVCPWDCPLILSCLGKHSCGPVCRPELTLAADLRPCLERLACCSQGWLSAWSQEAGHSLQAFLIFWICWEA